MSRRVFLNDDEVVAEIADDGSLAAAALRATSLEASACAVQAFVTEALILGPTAGTRPPRGMVRLAFEDGSVHAVLEDGRHEQIFPAQAPPPAPLPLGTAQVGPERLPLADGTFVLYPVGRPNVEAVALSLAVALDGGASTTGVQELRFGLYRFDADAGWMLLSQTEVCEVAAESELAWVTESIEPHVVRVSDLFAIGALAGPGSCARLCGAPSPNAPIVTADGLDFDLGMPGTWDPAEPATPVDMTPGMYVGLTARATAEQRAHPLQLGQPGLGDAELGVAGGSELVAVLGASQRAFRAHRLNLALVSGGGPAQVALYERQGQVLEERWRSSVFDVGEGSGTGTPWWTFELRPPFDVQPDRELAIGLVVQDAGGVVVPVAAKAGSHRILIRDLADGPAFQIPPGEADESQIAAFVSAQAPYPAIGCEGATTVETRSLDPMSLVGAVTPARRKGILRRARAYVAASASALTCPVRIAAYRWVDPEWLLEVQSEPLYPVAETPSALTFEFERPFAVTEDDTVLLALQTGPTGACRVWCAEADAPALQQYTSSTFAEAPETLDPGTATTFDLRPLIIAVGSPY